MEMKYPPHVQKLLEALSPEQRRAQIAMIKFVRAVGLMLGLGFAIISVGTCIAAFHPQYHVMQHAIQVLGQDVGMGGANLVFFGGNLVVLSAGVQLIIRSRI